MDRRRAHHDWDEIRSFYEAGHSSAECRERFGFGGSSWDRAVKRGDIRPRAGGQGVVNEERREAVLALVEEGLSRVEVARRLGVSISTVAYCARTLGLAVDGRFARIGGYRCAEPSADDPVAQAAACSAQSRYSAA